MRGSPNTIMPETREFFFFCGWGQIYSMRGSENTITPETHDFFFSPGIATDIAKLQLS